jgi:hypothetical protein
MYVTVDHFEGGGYLWKLLLEKGTAYFEASTHLLHLKSCRGMCSCVLINIRKDYEIHTGRNWST